VSLSQPGYSRTARENLLKLGLKLFFVAFGNSTHLLLVRRPRMHGVIPPLPPKRLHGVMLNEAQGQLHLYFTYNSVYWL
jgi:hypothetical protein